MANLSSPLNGNTRLVASPATEATKPPAQLPLVRPGPKTEADTGGGVQISVPVLVLGHALLALLVTAWPQIGLVHALAVFAVGLMWAMSGKTYERVAYVGAYLVGSEIFWRMTDAIDELPWEYAKYVAIGIFLVAIMRQSRVKFGVLPLGFLLLLVPGMCQAFTKFNFEGARQQITFNLIGHVALVCGAWYFSNLTISKVEFRTICLALLAPIVSIATLILRSFLTSEAIVWSSESNFAASGGYGPNQVSSILGLGILVVFILLMVWQSRRVEQVFLVGLGIWLMAHSFLTFSRGGVLTATLASVTMVMHSLVDRTRRLQVILIIVFGYLFLHFVGFPQLDAWTGGSFYSRFSDFSLSRRDTVAEAQLQAFAEHPVWGAGPGGTVEYTQRLLGDQIAAHTEYTRLIAEHGIPGILAMALLAIMMLNNYWRRGFSQIDRGVVSAIILWALLFMGHSALRVVAPAFMLGLSFAKFDLEREQVPASEKLKDTGSALAALAG